VFKAPAADEPSAPRYEVPDEEIIAEPALSLPERFMRSMRRLRGDVSLRGRRRTIAVSVEDGVTRAVVFDKNEIVAWGKADPAEEEEAEAAAPGAA
jgi:hypothetical protein